ncbi:MAG TPA: glycosyltransferase [Candidatus Acidoferrales bacterium]|nr:glycosyltransferase [Candidatus Acidoferrales bacterium]
MNLATIATKFEPSAATLGVVVPTLNSAATLDWTLCSLLNQRNCALRVVVADSGSTDGTLWICRKWGVRSVYAPPGSLYRAVNEGLKNLDTEWMTFLNSDDVAYPHSYARLLQLGDAAGASLVYGHCDYMDLEGRFLFTWRAAAPSQLPAMFRRGVFGFAQPCAIFRRSLFQNLGGFDDRYRHVADLVFFSRAVLSGSPARRLSAPSVGAFRLHPGQLSARDSGAVRTEKLAHIDEDRLRPSISDRVRVLIWRLANLPNYSARLAATGRACWHHFAHS